MIKLLKLAVWVMLTEAIIGWRVEDFSRNFKKMEFYIKLSACCIRAKAFTKGKNENKHNWQLKGYTLLGV